MKLHTINTGFFKLDGGAMFGVVPKTIWNKSNPADANNLCTWALRCLLIEDGNRLILVDTGIGDKQDEKFFGHYHLHGNDSLESSLKSAGFNKEDITDVFLTHLHFDHCGGAIIRRESKLLPAFPNADYWSNEKHWRWATEPNDREKASFLKENILPIKESGRLKMIPIPVENTGAVVKDKESELAKIISTPGENTGDVMKDKESGLPKIVPTPAENTGGLNRSAGGVNISADGKLAETSFTGTIKVRFANGHTSAMMLPQMEYRGRTVVFMADLLPSAGHLPIPYVMAYDMFPLISLNEKKAFLDEALAGDYVLFFEHDPENECCTLQKTEKGIRVKDFFRLKDL